MTVIEKKQKLIASINNTDDENLLDQLLLAVNFEEDNSIYIMSPEEKEAVKEGLEQIERGEWITNEEADRRAEEWLNK